MKSRQGQIRRMLGIIGTDAQLYKSGFSCFEHSYGAYGLEILFSAAHDPLLNMHIAVIASFQDLVK